MEPTLDPQKAQDLENGVNQGVVEPTEEELAQTGDVAGASIIAPDSNIDSFLSDFDPQSNPNFDTLGCNIFSGIGGLELQINARGGDGELSVNGKAELSERKACVDCGLTGNAGSSEGQWEHGINEYGFVRNDLWPFTPGMTKAQFFSDPSPQIMALGKRALDRYDIIHRPVGTDDASLKEALKYGAVKVFIGTGPGWNVGEPNVVPKTNNPMNHAVLLRKFSDLGKHIRDQYAPFLKVLAPDYIIYYAFQTLLIPKGQSMPFVKSTLNLDGAVGVFLAAGEGTNVDPSILQDLNSIFGTNLQQHADGSIPTDKTAHSA